MTSSSAYLKRMYPSIFDRDGDVSYRCIAEAKTRDKKLTRIPVNAVAAATLKGQKKPLYCEMLVNAVKAHEDYGSYPSLFPRFDSVLIEPNHDAKLAARDFSDATMLEYDRNIFQYRHRSTKRDSTIPYFDEFQTPRSITRSQTQLLSSLPVVRGHNSRLLLHGPGSRHMTVTNQPPNKWIAAKSGKLV